MEGMTREEKIELINSTNEEYGLDVESMGDLNQMSDKEIDDLAQSCYLLKEQYK